MLSESLFRVNTPKAGVQFFEMRLSCPQHWRPFAANDDDEREKGLALPPIYRYRAQTAEMLTEARWRSCDADDCKSLHAGSIPARASTHNVTQTKERTAA